MAEIAVEANATPAQLPNMHVAVLGAGKMGGILLQAFLKQNLFAPEQIRATVAHAEKARRALARNGALMSAPTTSPPRAQADLILLGVKPFQVPDLVDADQAGARRPRRPSSPLPHRSKTRAIEDAAGIEIAVIRAMPNTPSALGAGIAGALPRPLRHRRADGAGRSASSRPWAAPSSSMKSTWTRSPAFPRSGPAYIYIIIEALAEAGVKVGLPRDIATQLAAQTAFGAAKMVLETGYHPALLKDAVTTPAGCTIDGILELEEGGLRVTLIKAVMRATERAKQLAAG